MLKSLKLQHLRVPFGKSSQWIWVHWVAFIMFRPTMHKLLSIEQRFSFKSKPKIIQDFVYTLGIMGKLLMGYDLVKVTWYLLDLRCWKHWNFSTFVIENSIKLQIFLFKGYVGTLLVFLESSQWVGFNKADFINLDLRCYQYWNLSNFLYWKFNYITKIKFSSRNKLSNQSILVPIA
jgi:hypothetical protein